MPEATSETPRRRLRFERLEARISLEQKKLFVRAAALEGRTLTDFVIGSLTKAAQRVVSDKEILVLAERDSAAFVREMLHPGPPNKALRAAARKYKKAVGLP